MSYEVRIDRPRCIGAGNCIVVAPTAFDWLRGDLGKAMVIDVDSVDEEALREAVLSCPTQAIVMEQVDELLPMHLRATDAAPRRVVATFMFTDIVGSTNLAEALGDEAWQALLQWHDEQIRGLLTQYRGQEVHTTGDGFFVRFDAPDDALACAISIQRSLAQHRKDHGFAPQVRIGIHLSDARQVGANYLGKGVHEAARIAAAAEGSQVLASSDTVLGTSFRTSDPRALELKGLSKPVEVVAVDWR